MQLVCSQSIAPVSVSEADAGDELEMLSPCVVSKVLMLASGPLWRLYWGRYAYLSPACAHFIYISVQSGFIPGLPFQSIASASYFGALRFVTVCRFTDLFAAGCLRDEIKLNFRTCCSYLLTFPPRRRRRLYYYHRPFATL